MFLNVVSRYCRNYLVMNRTILDVVLLKNNLSFYMRYYNNWLCILLLCEIIKGNILGVSGIFPFKICSKVTQPRVKVKGGRVCCLHAVNNCGREGRGLWSSGSGCMALRCTALRCGDGSSLPSCRVGELEASMSKVNPLTGYVWIYAGGHIWDPR